MSKKFTIENGIMKSAELSFENENMGLGKWLLETLESRRDFVGQVNAISGQETTYGEMFDKSVRCALWLRKQKINPEDVVLTCCFNQNKSYIPLLATFYNAATHIFVLNGLKYARMKYLIGLLKPKFIFAEEEEEAKLFEEVAREENVTVKIIVFTKSSEYCYLNSILDQANAKEVDEFRSLEPTNPDNDCLMALTSGSTGNPKVVVHSYKSIMNASLLNNSEEDETECATSLVPLTLSWFWTVRFMLNDILSFRKRLIVNERNHSLHEILLFIEKYKVTHVKFSTEMMYRLYKIKDIDTYNTSSLKYFKFMGLKLHLELIKWFNNFVKNECFVQLYGTTEVASEFSIGEMHKTDLNSCGYLNYNMLMKVVDLQNGRPLGPTESGEICFKSSCTMKSYFKNKEATDEAIDSEGWYHTGDLGYYDDSGLIYIYGRLKNSLILPSGNIMPLWNIERTLNKHQEVILTVVLPISEISKPLRVVAFVELVSGSKITEEELAEMVNIYSDINLSITVKILDAVPLTSSGKTNPGELRKKINDLLDIKEKLI